MTGNVDGRVCARRIEKPQRRADVLEPDRPAPGRRAHRAPDDQAPQGEGRYLFVSTGFDSSLANGTVPDETRGRLAVLRARFAPWYYVIAEDSFKKIRVSRADLLKPQPASDTR